MNGRSTRYCSSSLLKNAQTWRASPSCEPAREMGGAFLFMAAPPIRIAHDASCLNARTDGTRLTRLGVHFVAPLVHDTLVLIHSVASGDVSQGRTGAVPSLAAILTRSAREAAFIFRITFPRCALTVISLMPSSAPTCLFNSPETTHAITSRSRGLKDA